MGRVIRSPLVGQLIRFGAIGVLSTVAYVVLYALLREVAEPLVANAVALLVTAIANTAANRRLTFGVRDRETVLQHQLAGLIAFGVALAITSGSVALLGWLVPDAPRRVEIAVLVAANVAATVVRFVLLRTWIAPPSRVAATVPAGRLDRSPS